MQGDLGNGTETGIHRKMLEKAGIPQFFPLLKYFFRRGHVSIFGTGKGEKSRSAMNLGIIFERIKRKKTVAV